MEGDRESQRGEEREGKRKNPSRKEGRIVRGRQTDPAAGFLGWSCPSADADADAAAALMLRSQSQTRWRCAGSRMSGGAYQLLNEISKSRSKKKKKQLFPLSPSSKQSVLSMPSFFPLHGWGQSKESTRYFPILNRLCRNPFHRIA